MGVGRKSREMEKMMEASVKDRRDAAYQRVLRVTSDNDH